MISDRGYSFYELIKSCERALKTKRYSFYPNKDFGSEITAAVSEEALLAYARQALDGLDGVYVKSARFDGDRAVFLLCINNGEREVGIFI